VGAFLGGFLGIIVVLAIVILVIYFKLKAYFKSLGYSSSEIKDMIRKSDYDAKYREKSITGMTEFIVPRISKDYKNFNLSEFYNKVENSILGIYNSISDNKVSNNRDLSLIKDKLTEIINSNKSSNVKEKYEDIKFNKHAIKSYDNKNGALIITVATSLSFYYKKEKNNKVIEEYKDYSKQTSCITKYVHIYDPDKYDINKTYLASNCPNCGAVLKNYKTNTCDFCGTSVEPINLKSWYISEYKEDKR